jgi:small subunit ribosomal protein S6
VSATASKKMNNYEGMFLIHSGRFAANSEEVLAGLMEILEKCEAEVVAQRAWQDGKLAYEIEGQRKGLHYLVMFRMPTENASQLNRLCQLNDNILRQLIIKHPQVLFDANVAAIGKASPDASLGSAGDDDEAPAQDLNSDDIPDSDEDE